MFWTNSQSFFSASNRSKKCKHDFTTATPGCLHTALFIEHMYPKKRLDYCTCLWEKIEGKDSMTSKPSPSMVRQFEPFGCNLPNIDHLGGVVVLRIPIRLRFKSREVTKGSAVQHKPRATQSVSRLHLRAVACGFEINLIQGEALRFLGAVWF